jgi:hypothetical protein
MNNLHSNFHENLKYLGVSCHRNETPTNIKLFFDCEWNYIPHMKNDGYEFQLTET